MHLDLSLFSSKRTPVVMQSEAAECGLACLAMVAAHHGHRVELRSLRNRHSISLRGASLAELMRLAAELRLDTRPLRVELEHLAHLRLPCLLHWDLNHFVVLVRVHHDGVTIHDPACGRRRLSLDEVSKAFSGVALELNPAADFELKSETSGLKLHTLIGRLPGLAGTLLQALALALVLQLLLLIGPFYMQWVVDHALVAEDRDLVTVLGVGFLLLALLQVGVTALRGWVLMVLGTSLNLQLVTRLFRHLVRLPMAWFEKRHMGDVVSRFESVNVIQRTLTSGFLEALIDGLMVVVTLIMMLIYSIQLTLVVLAAATLYAVLRLLLNRPMRLATEEHIVRGARQHSHFLETLRGMQTVRLFGHETPRGARWQNLTVDAFNAGIRTERLGILYTSLNGMLFGIESVVTIWLGARLVLDAATGPAFTVGMLFAFIAYKTQFVQRFAGLLEKLIEFRLLGLHVDRIADIALVAPEASGPTNPGQPTRELSGRLTVHDASFRYAESDPLVLDRVSFEVAAGESVAIVGPSGCGKTTLMKLMLGLLQPTHGQILIDGIPLARIGLHNYREMVASVMQDDQLFAGSIAENICFFATEPDPDRIRECARRAAIDDDIETMPMQYHTLVGDMGTVLSGGQKQRILLARALYRSPRILFLDEATSHLDLARERSVNEAVRALPLTRIIVAHRPETIAHADRVIVIEAGRVANAMHAIDGSHPSQPARPGEAWHPRYA
nr:peptidase domain-containing ABC transporter [Zoogloeaceae bacterium]